MDRVLALAAAAALATSMASPVMAGGLEQPVVPVAVPPDDERDDAFAAASSIPALGSGTGAAIVIGTLALAAIVAASGDVSSGTHTTTR